jgi:hypothetical protein
MAGSNCILSALAAPDPLCDQPAARMFAEAFPALQLSHFKAMRKDRGYTRNEHIVGLSGPAAELTRSGIIDVGCLLPGRKRKAWHWFGEERESTSLLLSRIRGGAVHAQFHLYDDESLPADHPLQIFHPRQWPLGDHRDLRAFFERDRGDARTWITSVLASLDRMACVRKHGYKVHPGDAARMQQTVREFTDRLLAEFDSARVVSERAPQLEIVVNR